MWIEVRKDTARKKEVRRLQPESEILLIIVGNKRAKSDDTF